MVHAIRRARAYPSLRLGRFASSRPLSAASGFDRGTPIDRYFIERFLAANAADIRGHVLEVGEDLYARRFGGDRVVRQDILHVDASNPKATIVGDLAQAGLLPHGTFDCIILTQTLQYVFDVHAALVQVRSALRPGGVALITVPAIAPISPDDWRSSFYWRFTAPSLERLLNSVFGPAKTQVAPFGNLYAATHFLHGAALEEVNRNKLDPVMPEYAIVVVGRAVAA